MASFRGVSEGDVMRFAIAKPEPLRVEQANFRDAVLGGPPGIVTMREGVASLRVVEACLRSARTGAEVRLWGSVSPASGAERDVPLVGGGRP